MEIILGCAWAPDHVHHEFITSVVVSVAWVGHERFGASGIELPEITEEQDIDSSKGMKATALRVLYGT